MMPFLINSQPTSYNDFELCCNTYNRREYQTLHVSCTHKLCLIQAINPGPSEQLIIMIGTGNAMESFNEQQLAIVIVVDYKQLHLLYIIRR